MMKTMHNYISVTPEVKKDVTFQVEELEFIINNFNGLNRPLDKAHVNKIKSDIIESRYDYNTGNPIKFDIHGNVIDGHHRIKGHIAANAPFKTIVIYGLPPEALLKTDRIKVRNAAINGVLLHSFNTKIPYTQADIKNRSNIISIARNWQRFMISDAPCSESELSELCDSKHKFISDAIVPCSNRDTKRVGYQTALAIYFEKCPAKAEEFRDGVGGDGAGLAAGSAILMMRKHLHDAANSRERFVRLYKDYYVALAMIHAHENNTIVNRISQIKSWKF